MFQSKDLHVYRVAKVLISFNLIKFTFIIIKFNQALVYRFNRANVNKILTGEGYHSRNIIDDIDQKVARSKNNRERLSLLVPMALDISSDK